MQHQYFPGGHDVKRDELGGPATNYLEDTVASLG